MLNSRITGKDRTAIIFLLQFELKLDRIIGNSCSYNKIKLKVLAK